MSTEQYIRDISSVIDDIEYDTDHKTAPWLQTAFEVMGTDEIWLQDAIMDGEGRNLTETEIRHVLITTFAFLAWSEPEVQNHQLSERIAELEDKYSAYQEEVNSNVQRSN